MRFYSSKYPQSVSDSLITTQSSHNIADRNSLINCQYDEGCCRKYDDGTVYSHANCTKLIIKDGWRIVDDYPW